MKLRILRHELSDKSTIGSLFIDGAYQCFTLERPVGSNRPHQDAIPDGTYKVQLTPSPRFNMLVPILRDVPGRSSIEMHIGNMPADVHGCIALGKTKVGADFIGESRLAFDAVMAKLKRATEGIELTIITEPTSYDKNGDLV